MLICVTMTAVNTAHNDNRRWNSCETTKVSTADVMTLMHCLSSVRWLLGQP